MEEAEESTRKRSLELLMWGLLRLGFPSIDVTATHSWLGLTLLQRPGPAERGHDHMINRPLSVLRPILS